MDPSLPNRQPVSLPPVSTPPAEAGAGKDERLLTAVLERTCRTALQSDPLSAADWEALQRVARRHPQPSPLSEAVLSEMVAAVLREPLLTLANWDAFCSAAAGHIAHTLMEDPFTRNRLERLWRRLAADRPAEGGP